MTSSIWQPVGLAQFAKKSKGKGAGKEDKKQAEKAQVYEQFEGVSIDDLHQSFQDDLDVSTQQLFLGGVSWFFEARNNE